MYLLNSYMEEMNKNNDQNLVTNYRPKPDIEFVYEQKAYDFYNKYGRNQKKEKKRKEKKYRRNYGFRKIKS
jgi:hypothetical protein